MQAWKTGAVDQKSAVVLYAADKNEFENVTTLIGYIPLTIGHIQNGSPGSSLSGCIDGSQR